MNKWHTRTSLRIRFYILLLSNWSESKKNISGTIMTAYLHNIWLWYRGFLATAHQGEWKRASLRLRHSCCAAVAIRERRLGGGTLWFHCGWRTCNCSEATHNSKVYWRGVMTEQLEILGSSFPERKYSTPNVRHIHLPCSNYFTPVLLPASYFILQQWEPILGWIGQKNNRWCKH